MKSISFAILVETVALASLTFQCTKLDSPNDQFGSVVATGGTGNAGGNDGGSDASASCHDPLGLNGLGCYSCAPTDISGLESACTTASCTLFDNQHRLTRLLPNGQLPALPARSTATGGLSSTGGTSGISTTPASGGTDSADAGTATSPSTGGSSAGGATSSVLRCDSLSTQGTVVYVTGSSAAKPFLQQIAQQLTSVGVYLVYTSTGSCIGVDAILNGTPMTTGPAPAPAANAVYWDSNSSTGVNCMLPDSGIAADMGISDVFAQTCPGFELASLESKQVREAHGPIQTMAFVVPTNSPYSEISAQAAFFAFGFGADGGVLDAASMPIWNDEAYLFQRSASSGTQAMIAASIGVPADQWKGKSHKSSDDVAADIQLAGATQESANKAVGILAADYIDSKNLRAQIRILSYQDTNQPCAFSPDSSGNSHDKRNVRDGHYPIWSPLHILYKVDASQNPVNPANRQQVSDIIGYLSGSKVLPNGIKLLDVYAQSGLIPECAMHVTRQQDGGNMFPFAPPNPCSCVFEFKATGSSTCKTCAVQGDCAASETCSLGYCEK